MELRDYLRILGRRMVMFALIMVIFALGFFWYGKNRPITYEGARSITVVKIAEDKAPANFYKYDNFYTAQASGLYSEIITGWLQDPAMVQEVYAQENLGPADGSLKNLGKRFLFKKLSNGVIQIIVNDKDKMVVEKLLNGLEKSIRANVDGQLIKEGGWNDVVLKFSPVLILAQKASASLYMAVGFFVGFILGLITVFLVEYLQPVRTNSK